MIAPIKPTEEKKVLPTASDADPVDCSMAQIHRLLSREKTTRRKSIFNTQCENGKSNLKKVQF